MEDLIHKSLGLMNSKGGGKWHSRKESSLCNREGLDDQGKLEQDEPGHKSQAGQKLFLVVISSVNWPTRRQSD